MGSITPLIKRFLILKRRHNYSALCFMGKSITPFFLASKVCVGRNFYHGNGVFYIFGRHFSAATFYVKLNRKGYHQTCITMTTAWIVERE